MDGPAEQPGGPGDQPGAARPAGVELAPGVRVAPDALAWSFARSSGPGGQNVNKRATKAELRVNVSSLPLPGWAAARVRELAGGLVTASGELVITADEHRSQARNRAECLRRLRDLVVRALARPKRRRRTRPTRGSVERRLEGKRRRAEAKRRRADPE